MYRRQSYTSLPPNHSTAYDASHSTASAHLMKEVFIAGEHSALKNLSIPFRKSETIQVCATTLAQTSISRPKGFGSFDILQPPTKLSNNPTYEGLSFKNIATSHLASSMHASGSVRCCCEDSYFSSLCLFRLLVFILSCKCFIS